MNKKVKREDFKFLEKISKISDQAIIKKIASNEKTINITTCSDESGSIIIQSVKLTPIFDLDGEFRLTNIKHFLKAVDEYGEVQEDENYFTFATNKKKLIFRKTLDNENSNVISDFIKGVNLQDYITIHLSFNEIKNIREGLENKISDYVYFVLENGKLLLKIGAFSHENLFEEEIIDVKTNENIKFLTKVKNFKELFDSLDDDSEYTLCMKKESNCIIFAERNVDFFVKTFIACVDDVNNNIN